MIIRTPPPPVLLLISPLVLLLTAVAVSGFVSSINKVPNYFTGSIGSDERVLFFPTVGNKINSTHWHVPIHGWIFEPELESKKRRVTIKGIGKVFKVKDDDEKRMLKRRLMPFTGDNKSMKYVNVKVGETSHRLPRSSKDGHFIGHLALTDDELSNAPTSDDGKVVHYTAIDDKERTFTGSIHLLSPTGTSIISDIDDTVKITNYLDKKEFYKNTFLREFKEVPGMSGLYTKISQSRNANGDDVSFHYVSASPYQLYEELSTFFTRIGFPPATYHLKRIRIKDKTLLDFFACPMEYKLRQIEPLLETFPERKFILVGDSGEKDPEIYSELYKKYPGQIERIWIRNVNGANETRMEGVDGEKWRYFDDGFDLLEDVV